MPVKVTITCSVRDRVAVQFMNGVMSWDTVGFI